MNPKGVILTTHSVYSSFDSEINVNKKTVEKPETPKESIVPDSGSGSRLRQSRMSKEQNAAELRESLNVIA